MSDEFSTTSALLGGAVQGGLAFAGANAKENAILTGLPNPVQLSTIQQSQQTFLSQGGQLASVAALMEKAAKLDSKSYQDRLSAVDPTVLARTKQAGELAAKAAQGELTQDELDQIKDENAYAQFQGGYYGSGMAEAQLTKNTALARLQKMRTAPEILAQSLEEAKSLNPSTVDVGSTLLTPAAIRSRSNANEIRNNQIGNQQNVLNGANAASNANALFGGLAQTAGSVFSALDSVTGVKDYLGTTMGRAGSTPPTSGTGYASLGG